MHLSSLPKARLLSSLRGLLHPRAEADRGFAGPCRTYTPALSQRNAARGAPEAFEEVARTTGSAEQSATRQNARYENALRPTLPPLSSPEAPPQHSCGRFPACEHRRCPTSGRRAPEDCCFHSSLSSLDEMLGNFSPARELFESGRSTALSPPGPALRCAPFATAFAAGWAQPFGAPWPFSKFSIAAHLY